MRIKWLHLSDIHFNYKNYNSHSLREDFLKRVLSLSQSEPFTHLFITGDILYRNQKADLETIDFIRSLVSNMKLSSENVYIIPGNHDHDRNITISILNDLFSNSDEDKHSFIVDNLRHGIISKLLESHENYYEAYNSIFNEPYYSETTQPHIILTNNDLTIIKINTSWLDMNSSLDKDYLMLGTRLLQELMTEHNDTLSKTVNIAIGHHSLGDMLPEERARVLDQFFRHNVGLYFCGHRHKPAINYYSDYDLLEFIAPGGFNDGYSDGGYIWGIIDTDTDFYKAEVYGWYNNKWCIESKLNGTDDYGIYYFQTKRYSHCSDIIAIDCKTIGGHISRKDLEKSLCCQNFDVHIYNGPYKDVSGYTQESICDFCDSITDLIEKNKKVHLYPLAPIPMLIGLGFYLQKNSSLIIHQFDRDTESWVLDEKQDNFRFLDPTYLINGKKALAVIISTSFNIDFDQVKKALINKEYDYICFSSKTISPGYPLYNNDVKCAIAEIMNALNPRANDYDEIHFFAAIPAGMAVELGRNLLKSVYKNIFTYQYEHGEYHNALVLNSFHPLASQNPHTNSSIFVDWLTIDNARNVIIKGKGPCGFPRSNEAENDTYIPILESILDTGDYFIVEAAGDSMIDAGINDGDYILVKSQPVAEDGDIVIALIEDELTIKRYYRDNNRKKFILHPENSNYSDMFFEELEIQGVAVHVIKKL